MTGCAVVIKRKATMSEAEPSRRLGAIYRIILEALGKAAEEQKRNAEQQIGQDVKP